MLKSEFWWITLERDFASKQNLKLPTNSTPQLRPPLPFTDAGIHFHPLRSGSWVLVGFKDQIWLGNGKTNFGFSRIYYLTISLLVKIIYTKGGGKKPTHNYATSCGNVNDLSRFVVQLYARYGTMLTPLICKPANYFRDAPSILPSTSLHRSMHSVLIQFTPARNCQIR